RFDRQLFRLLVCDIVQPEELDLDPVVLGHAEIFPVGAVGDIHSGRAADDAIPSVEAIVVAIFIGCLSLWHALRQARPGSLLGRIPVVVVCVPGADVPDWNDDGAVTVCDSDLELVATLTGERAEAGQG